MHVKNSTNVNKEIVKSGTKTYRQVLIGPNQGPNFAMRKFVIAPGGSMPRHKNTVEHEQYVLNGRAKIEIGESEYEVKKDDVVFIPAGVPHCYETIGEEAFEFICVVPNKSDEIKLV